MKYLMSFFMFLLVSISVQAADLSKEALQGSWLILTMNGEPDKDKDKWEFEGNRFYQNLGGRRISPDEFKVHDKLIDLGYAKIKVLKFDGHTMTANMAGFVYVLRKQ